MKKRLLIGLVAGGLMAAMLPGVASADRDACKRGGWRDLVTASGEAFRNQGQCVRYSNQGGSPRASGAVLAVAYSDLNGSDGYQGDSADVLIAMFVDTDDNGADPGDRIVMGRYPKNFAASDFGHWTVNSHRVTSGASALPSHMLEVRSDEGLHAWVERSGAGGVDLYIEGDESSAIRDGHVRATGDYLLIREGSPSRPDTALIDEGRQNDRDDAFIDVDVFLP